MERMHGSGGAPLTHSELLQLGSAFTGAWFKGIAAGPAAVQDQLTQVLDPGVVLMADGVRREEEVEGLAGLLAELERAHLEYGNAHHRTLLAAASEGAQRAYALVECRYQDVGGLPGHPATFRVSRVAHIVAAQATPGNRRIGVLWLRRQLTEEDKDEVLVDPVHSYPVPFPEGDLTARGGGTGACPSDAAMAAAVRRWWHSWQTPPGPAPPQRSDAPPSPAPLSSDFRLHDAYGLWPSMRGGTSGGDGSNPGNGSAARRSLSREGVLRYRAHLQRLYSIKLRVVDVAPAAGQSAAFAHWRATFTRRAQADVAAGLARASEGVVVSGPAAPAGATRAEGGAGDGEREARAAASAPAADVQAGADAPSGSSVAGTAAAPLTNGRRRMRRGASFVMEGLEVDLFGGLAGMREAAPACSDAPLSHVWLFRGPLDSERKLLLSSHREAAAAEGARVEAAQAALWEGRRQAREAQLTELLTWMDASRRQLTEAMVRVQGAITWQQQRQPPPTGSDSDDDDGGDEGGAEERP